MENVAASAPPSANAKSSRGRNSRQWLGGALLFFLWFVLCRHLSGEWSVNEQYSYGWFVPFFAAYLFWLRFEEIRGQRFATANPSSGGSEVRGQSASNGTEVGERPREVRGQQSAVRRSDPPRRGFAIGAAVLALLVLFPVRLFEIANPDWRPLGWVHAFAVITITSVVIYFAGGWRWIKHFSFPILFFLVAVPWVTPFEQPIVQGLMRAIAAIASESLNLFGVPAQLQGSMIAVRTGLVDVNEACSGVRSLQTSLMIALLFGELNRLTPWRRVSLVFGALSLALVANTIRAFFLVWIAATKGMSAIEKTHDLAGYAILAIVFIGSLGLARWLGRGRAEGGRRKAEIEKGGSPRRIRPLADRRSEPSSILHPLSSFQLPTSCFLFPLLWLFAIELGVESWYRMHERVLTRAPQWTVVWPNTQAGFRNLEIDDRVRGTLRYNTGGGAVWRVNRNSPETAEASPGSTLKSILYFFRWEPGRSSVLRARAHRPDICLPSTGWKQTADNGVRAYPTQVGFDLPFRHFEFAQENTGSAPTVFAHTFFCIWQDRSLSGSGAAIEITSETTGGWSVVDRWRTVLNGQREIGQQVIELVLTSPRQISPAEAEQIFSDQIKNVVKPSPAL